MKIISFCLWGSNPMYIKGVEANIQLARELFPEWTTRVYFSKTVPLNTLNNLRKNKDVEFIYVDEEDEFSNTLWRFKPIQDKSIERFIVRDCDSRLSPRDRVAVNEWVQSDYDFHVVRDHPVGHSWGINAGIFGSKGGTIPDFFSLFDTYYSERKKNNSLVCDKYIDQCFLRDIIHPKVVGKVLLHDEFFDINFNGEGKGLKIQRDRALDNFAFLGEVVDEFNVPLPNQRETIIKSLKGEYVPYR